MIIENFRMAFRSLRGSKLRSFLTMLGIIIGVAAVVAILAIGDGVKNAVTGQISNLGAGVMTVTSGGGGSLSAGLGSSTLTTADAATIAATTGVKSSTPVGVVSGVVARDGVAASGLTIEAAGPSIQQIMSLKLAAGRFLAASDTTALVAVLDDQAATTLFGATPASQIVGQTITARNQVVSVIGVTSPTESAFGGNARGGMIYVPFEAGQILAGGTLPISQILVVASDPQQIDAAVKRITTRLTANHAGQKDFQIITQQDLLKTFDMIFSLLTDFIAAIASISLLVGGIGIMNIMLVSVTERTREIGIRKALGASNATVLSQFVIEAIVLSLLGGALGLAAAYGMASIAGALADITPSFTWGSIALAVGISGGIGIIFGIAPAIKAARMKPIDALRFE